MNRLPTAAELICSTISGLGIKHVFGMPGTQLIALYSALRRSNLRTVLATQELAAAFMANGYYRASGQPAALVTIPGPGFTYTLTGLAEARHDSAGILYLLVRKQNPPGGPHGFQLIDQKNMAASLVKSYLTITDLGAIVPILKTAMQEVTTGQPGPVIVEIDVDLLSQTVPNSIIDITEQSKLDRKIPVEDIRAVADRLTTSKRPLLLCGQGTQAASSEMTSLVETLRCPVATTISGRGVLAEDHPNVVAPDYGVYGVSVLNELIAVSDLVLAIGCKLSHNGTAGFKLKLPQEKLIHVDADPGVPGVNYPTSLSICADAPSFLSSLNRVVTQSRPQSGWTSDDIAQWRSRYLEELRRPRPHFPRAVECNPPEIAHLYEVLRRVLPRDCTIVTDSGLHQFLTRCYLPIFASRGLVVPSDYQSMGYGIPAAVGAKLARPDRPTVVITGDGGFAITAMELLTAVREEAPLVVIVFNDGVLGLIREQQADMTGDTFGITLQNPDFEAFADAIGLDYHRLHGHIEHHLKSALANPRGAIVEVRLQQSTARRVKLAHGRVVGASKRRIRSWLPAFIGRLLKR
jgi:acetolactate synthase I/II/III large subunit